jgi:hypothetical protein
MFLKLSCSQMPWESHSSANSDSAGLSEVCFPNTLPAGADATFYKGQRGKWLESVFIWHLVLINQRL